MLDIPAIVIAILLTLIAGAALLLAVALSAIDAWREYARKRPGYLELRPTPGRSRLGIETKRPPRGTSRRRP